jgi:hypothetical protein
MTALRAFRNNPLYFGTAFLAFNEKLRVAVLALLEVARVQVTAFWAEQPFFPLH